MHSWLLPGAGYFPDGCPLVKVGGHVRVNTPDPSCQVIFWIKRLTSWYKCLYNKLWKIKMATSVQGSTMHWANRSLVSPLRVGSGVRWSWVATTSRMGTNTSRHTKRGRMCRALLDACIAGCTLMVLLVSYWEVPLGTDHAIYLHCHNGRLFLGPSSMILAGGRPASPSGDS